MSKRTRTGRPAAFTLIELLVVIAIISVLVGLLLPAVQKVRDAMDRKTCANNLRQIGLALHHYHDARGSFPAAYLYTPPPQDRPLNVYTSPGWGWAAQLLPYLDQSVLAQQIDYDVAVEDARHEAVRTTPLKVFVCPSDQSTGVFEVLDTLNQPLAWAATTSYAACFGTGGEIGERPALGDGLFYRNSAVTFAQVTDGASNTIAVGERAALFCQTPWAGTMSGASARTTPGAPVLVTIVEEAPVQVMASMRGWPLNSVYSTPYDFFSPHTDMVQLVFADGAVHALSSQIDGNVLLALATIAGGEVIDMKDY
jgi:prepilin-type N-terminal cleavage/methylation domain-containing protein